MPEFDYRLKVKGGLTGFAQIYGKYNTTPYDKLKLDLMYIENYSLRLDLKLILVTLKVIFMKESTEGVQRVRLPRRRSRPALRGKAEAQCRQAAAQPGNRRYAMRKIRVLQVNKLYYPAVGGIERIVQYLAEGLKDETDMKVLVCQPKAGAPGMWFTGCLWSGAAALGLCSLCRYP